ncbi:MAG: DUF5615 family PIN-like protein [Roseiarcus sp.]
MRFLVDAQLPPALARRLAEPGHEAERVADRQLAAASDTASGWRERRLGKPCVRRRFPTLILCF